MGFNSAFKGLKLFKNPGNVSLNNLNILILHVLITNMFLSLLQSSSEQHC